MEKTLTALLIAAATLAGPSQAARPDELLSSYAAQAPAKPSAEQGRRFFEQRHGREWSCSSCHGSVPVQPGKHASTGKAIGPLAPAANPERFTDPAKVEKWFRRNCNDVLGRECSAGEKADVLAWLVSLQPGGPR